MFAPDKDGEFILPDSLLGIHFDVSDHIQRAGGDSFQRGKGMKPDPRSFQFQLLIKKFHVGGRLYNGQGPAPGSGRVGARQVIGDGEKNHAGSFPEGLVRRESAEIEGNRLNFVGHLLFRFLYPAALFRTGEDHSFSMAGRLRREIKPWLSWATAVTTSGKAIVESQ